MKKSQKVTKSKTDRDQVYSHLLNVMSHLRSRLKMEFAFVGLKSTDSEDILLETIKGLDYIKSVLFGFFVDEDSFKEIMEWQKEKEREFKFSSLE